MRFAYTLWAPIYDRLVEKPTQELRRQSLANLGDVSNQYVLIIGIGTGLDLPHLPDGAHYYGLDLTPAMLEKARLRAQALDKPVELREGNAMDLPFTDQQFDVVIMHTILAVVSDPDKALAEASRVLKPGGRLLIADKFLKPGDSAPLRRLLGFILRPIATRTDVVFEYLLKKRPELSVVRDEASLLGGWFRCLKLEKTTQVVAH